MAEQFESKTTGDESQLPIRNEEQGTEIQNDPGIVRDGAFKAATPEGPGSIMASNLTRNERAGELDEQATNPQALQSEGDQLARRRPVGPRSRIGKRRSSHNAIKSGIFAKTTLLKGESAEEYQRLRERFWKAKLPGDGYEELLLDMVVSNVWRQLRVLAVENAEIQMKSEFLEYDRRRREEAEATRITNESKQPGEVDVLAVEAAPLISNVDNPLILQQCINLLAHLRYRIEFCGFVEDWDRSILNRVYGEPSIFKYGYTIHDKYSLCLDTAQVPEEERKKGYSTPEECERIVIRAIGAEIRGLKQYQRRSELMESKRRKLEIPLQRVPDSPVLDRLLRSRNSLEREFYRLMAEYERAQRIRRGQPLPPQVDVRIS
jgi:hypothetical protein